ncbi:type II secretion system protein TadC [Thiohalobacter sp. COW1]|uniref:type II secretion system F family protein n=1 Tax=Thiohalobacter sp. COW1 TaxID=2795687 RepID=UPI0019163168|nr:type II secretion system F family protein [Thiohalobacter sp. COW1]BCO31777.1 type II secretion system protein TadC [Thiohalobacter sp. COW1]
MNTEVLVLLASLLGLVSLGLLCYSLCGTVRLRVLSDQRFGHLLKLDSDSGSASNEAGIVRLLESWLKRIGLRQPGSDLRSLLDNAGILRPDVRVLVQAGVVIAPFLFALLSVMYILLTEDEMRLAPAAFIFGVLFGYLTPRYVLRYLADSRRRALADEALIMVHLMKMLFDAGLSIEQALRTLHAQGGVLLPRVRQELEWVLKRIEAGMERSEVLGEWAVQVGVNELSDLAEMLAQLSRQGGNVQKSLADMALLMEDRNRTRLREKVGKLSGKMTVVMVLFLFPALMIFVAGPGVMALAAALGGVR